MHGDGQRRGLHKLVRIGERNRKFVGRQRVGERRNGEHAIDRLVLQGHRILAKRDVLDLDVGDRHADGLHDLADLVGADRAGRVAGNDLALEVLDALDLILEVGPDHQIMTDRRGDAVDRDDDRQLLVERVEIAGRYAAGDDVELALRQARHAGGRGLQILKVELDAGVLEVTLLLRHQQCAVRHRAHHADLDGFFRLAGAAGDGNAEPREQNPCEGSHDRSSPWP